MELLMSSTTVAEPITRIVPGWDGRYFEDFTVGDVYGYPLGRTVLSTEDSWFTLLSQNTSPLHFDRCGLGSVTRPAVEEQVAGAERAS